MMDSAVRLEDDEEFEIHESLGASQRCAAVPTPLCAHALCVPGVRRAAAACGSRACCGSGASPRDCLLPPCSVCCPLRPGPPCDQHAVQGRLRRAG